MILCYWYWQEEKRERNGIREDKKRFGELRACPPALTASPGRALRAGLMDAPTPNFPPSFCEVSCSPWVKHAGVWEEDVMHTLTLHKDFVTAWELSRNVIWTPGNYAVLIGPSDRHPEHIVLIDHAHRMTILRKPRHALWRGLGVSWPLREGEEIQKEKITTL